MTNKEAIQILRCSGYTSNPIEIDEAIELACKALETIDKIEFNVYALNEFIKEQKNEIN